MDRDRAGRLFPVFLVLTTMVALVCGFLWYLSPLGLGFANAPADPLTRKLAFAVHSASWYGGIPAPAIGQVLSAILAMRRRTAIAYFVPLASIGSFLLCAGLVLLLFSAP